uniref:Uncharacterized protein n=1 Tax=Anguilla anguilla TaxID=7936 RepID=A0A0E9QYN8_ANGAN
MNRVSIIACRSQSQIWIVSMFVPYSHSVNCEC